MAGKNKGGREVRKPKQDNKKTKAVKDEVLARPTHSAPPRRPK
jgi:hypothetical protein